MTVDYQEILQQPQRSLGSLKRARIAVMVLVVVATGVIISYFLFKPSFSQEAKSVRGPAKVNTAVKLREGDAVGEHDIFTTEKYSTYLIYGWAKFPNATGEPLTLTLNIDQDRRTLQTKTLDQTEVFFFEKARLSNNTTVRLQFKSECTDNLFHVYELGFL